MGVFDIFKKKKSPLPKSEDYQQTEINTSSKADQSSLKLMQTAHIYQEESFYVVGTQYYKNNLYGLARSNPDYRKSGAKLSEEEKYMQKIFQYNFINKPVKLIPEPKNKHDRHAVMVKIGGLKIGYISREDNKNVLDILTNHDIKSVSSSISGGKYKVASKNGDVVEMENYVSVRVKISYK